MTEQPKSNVLRPTSIDSSSRSDNPQCPNERWNVATIGELCELSSGTTPARNRHARYYQNGTINWVKTLDLNNSLIKVTDEKVTDQALNETSPKVFPVGTVLVAMYGGFRQIGRTGLLGTPAAVNQALTAILPSENRIESRFLQFVLNYRVDHWKTVASSSRKDPNITSREVRDFAVEFPNLSQQFAIANALSDVDELIGSLDKLITKKRAIKLATMQQLLTGKTRLPGFGHKVGFIDSAAGTIPVDWEVRLLPQVCRFRSGKAHESYVSDTGRFVCVNSKFISSDGKNRKFCTANLCPAALNDVLVVMSDLPNGKALAKAYFAETDDLYAVNQRVCALSAFGVHARFLFYILNRNKYFLKFNDGVNQTHLLNGVFAKSPIAIPPSLEEQAAIATVLTDMDSEITALEKRREKTKAIKQGMMQALLTGRVRLVESGKLKVESGKLKVES